MFKMFQEKNISSKHNVKDKSYDGKLTTLILVS